jgi:hypothetical protein
MIKAVFVGTLVGPVAAAGIDLMPGLYQIEVKIALPHAPDVAPPTRIVRCLTPADLESGRAFFVLSDNPIKACALIDFQAAEATASYRIVCPGPNAASATAVFETTDKGYRGVIKMQMGGKNMTMSEIQTATRAGECK